MYYNGLKVFDDSGYPAVYLPSSRYAKSNSTVRVHRLQAEILLGRCLSDTEVVHHKDGNKYNWDLTNLMVFISTADHAAFHRGCNPVYDEINHVYFCPDKRSITYCKDCGKLIYKTSIRCCSCNQLFLNGNKIPSRQELKDLIREHKFTEIGRIFNVSDNAVRKWCKKYNLPYSSKLIKTYTDDEWSLV